VTAKAVERFDDIVSDEPATLVIGTTSITSSCTRSSWARERRSSRPMYRGSISA
jgi:hypothetical protein